MNAASHGPVDRALTRNPVWLREWRAASRLAATPWLIALSGVGMAVLLGLVAMKMRDQLAEEVGCALFHVYFGLSAMFVTLFGPAIAANSIALEREGKTWDALMMAGVAPRTLDRGKFLGAYTQLALTVSAFVPAAAFPLIYGGVSHLEVALGLVLVFVLGALAARFGLAISAALPSTRMALLVTVNAAAILCVGVGTLGVGGAKWLSRHAEMTGVAYDTWVFWPVAIAKAELGFDYVRYLLLAPLTFAALAWIVLRELTVAALTTAPKDPQRGLRATFLVASPVLAMTLGVLPHHEWGEVFGAESVFAMFVFGAIVVLGAVRTPPRRPGRDDAALSNLNASGLLWIASVGGMLLVALLGETLASLEFHPFTGSTSAVDAMRLSGPAFATFLVGVGAYARSRLETARARAVVFATPLLVVVGATLLAMGLTFANDGHRVSWPIEMSPLAVMEIVAFERLALAAALWTALGVALVVLAYVRDRKHA